MKLSWFISNRLGNNESKSFTKLIIRFAVAGIGLSLAVMILAVGIVQGFKHEIKQKIVGYGGHVQIKNLDLNVSKEARLIPKDTALTQKISSMGAVKYIQAFTNKGGILQNNGQIEGLLFKGLPLDFRWDFFEKSLVRGRKLNLDPNAENYEMLISENTAKRMLLDTGMYSLVYFIQNGQVRTRKPLIVGIFNTGLSEFDQTVALVDMRVIQRIYSSGFDSINGYEIFLKDFNTMQTSTAAINDLIDYRLKASSASDMNSLIFDWLDIVDTNAIVIIVLMIIVAIINMCTALLILIVERTNMIGILKALGSTNFQVKSIFLQKGLQLIFKGIIIGNVLGLGIGWALIKYHLVGLDQSIYYMDSVPFLFDFKSVLLLNAGTIGVCFVIMLLPSILVNKITPIKAIRFS